MCRVRKLGSSFRPFQVSKFFFVFFSGKKKNVEFLVDMVLFLHKNLSMDGFALAFLQHRSTLLLLFMHGFSMCSENYFFNLPWTAKRGFPSDLK
jgi:hypothetical protein